MKITLLLLLFTILPVYSISSANTSNNTLTELEKRSDGIAVILNNNFSENSVKERIRRFTGTGDEIKNVYPGVYQIIFSNGKQESELDLLQNQLKLQTDMFKIVTRVYYGTSKLVTQIPGDEIIVKLRNKEDEEKLNIFNIQNNCIVTGSSTNGIYIIKTGINDSRNAVELSSEYMSYGIFEYAEPDFIYPDKCLLLSIPNDQYFNSQWALRNVSQTLNTGSPFLFQGDAYEVNGITNADMRVSDAWDYTDGSPSIKIGIIDSGIDSLHPDLQAPGHILPGYDAFNNTEGSAVDYGSHGTSVAGIIGAVKDNSIGIAGIAPGCKIMSITIYDENGTTTTSKIARAFDTARVRGLDIICSGWGGGSPSPTITQAINNAAVSGRSGSGALIFFSSGNDGRNPPVYPSYLDNVVSVGGSTPHDQKKAPGTGNEFYWGSNYGEDENGDLDISAPSNCYSLFDGGTYIENFSGSSAATPNAAGVAALILSVNPTLSRQQALNILYRGCDKIDNVCYDADKTYGKWNYYLGYGRVNAYNSVRLAAGVDITPPVIVHSNVSSHSSTYPTIIKANITDQDGTPVPTGGDNAPLLFYQIKKGNGNWSSFQSTGSYLNNGNDFCFKIPSQGYETEVKYYIRARDNNGNESVFPAHAPEDMWLCYFSVGEITTDTRKIPHFTGADLGPTVSPAINFPGFKILHAKITIYMRHTYLNDEIIQIFAPIPNSNINRKCLFSANGGNMDNITGASVTDSAVNFWRSSQPPYLNQTFMPEYSLNGLNGQNAGGPWRILHFDRGIGDYAFFDSVKVTLSKTTGVASASIKLDNPEDSIVNFENAAFPDIVEKDFYIKNSGLVNLNISGFSISGINSSLFTVVNTPPATILPNDSGLFKVKLNTQTLGASNLPQDNFENAVLSILTNDPSKSQFKVSLQTNSPLQSNVRNLNLKVLVEGFYNEITNRNSSDTINVYLRSASLPYSIVDSARSINDTSGNCSLNFSNSADNVNYYIVVKHRNSIETWSSVPKSFVSSFMNYDFTSSASSAYGNNLYQKGQKYCIFSGDVNRDGFVELSDLNQIYNAANNFLTGYVQEDINGDNVVELSDLTADFNNANKFVTVLRP
ncbi:MAG: S8 family serine peptidase [Ignavibacteriae bacterium]|nr:S8 family serine peptidase [Ignavibacteriota bacterium]